MKLFELEGAKAAAQKERPCTRGVPPEAAKKLRLRDLALLVRRAQRHSCEVAVLVGGRRANAKSILELSRLEFGRLAPVLLEAKGDGAKECLESLHALILQASKNHPTPV
jgi:phosphotransferase system HPr-like phosphotransfer protein